MPTCADIEPLITAVLDSQATPAERATVAGHLRACARCRRRSADEDAGRRILRERAATLHVEAPAALEVRCRPLRKPDVPLSATPAPAPWARPALRAVPVWATAVLAVTILVGAVAFAGRGSTAFAAGLALDHVKCFALFENSSGPGDPGTIEGRLKASYGWSLAVPAGSAALGLRLVGGRRCLSTDGRVAHILYRHGTHALSLFVLPQTSRSAARVAVVGHEAIIWSQGGATYAVVSREPPSDVARVAQYIKETVGSR